MGDRRWSSVTTHLAAKDDRVVRVVLTLDRVGDFGAFLAEDFDEIKAWLALRRTESIGRPIRDAEWSGVEWSGVDRRTHRTTRADKGLSKALSPKLPKCAADRGAGGMLEHFLLTWLVPRRAPARSAIMAAVDQHVGACRSKGGSIDHAPHQRFQVSPWLPPSLSDRRRDAEPWRDAVSSSDQYCVRRAFVSCSPRVTSLSIHSCDIGEKSVG